MRCQTCQRVVTASSVGLPQPFGTPAFGPRGRISKHFSLTTHDVFAVCVVAGEVKRVISSLPLNSRHFLPFQECTSHFPTQENPPLSTLVNHEKSRFTKKKKARSKGREGMNTTTPGRHPLATRHNSRRIANCNKTSCKEKSKFKHFFCTAFCSFGGF